MVVLLFIYIVVTILISLLFFLIPGFESENFHIALIVRDKVTSIKCCFSVSFFFLLFSFYKYIYIYMYVYNSYYLYM